MDRMFAPIPNTVRMQPTTKFKFKFRCTCNLAAIFSGSTAAWLVLHWNENQDQGRSVQLFGSAVLLGKWPMLHLHHGTSPSQHLHCCLFLYGLERIYNISAEWGPFCNAAAPLKRSVQTSTSCADPSVLSFVFSVATNPKLQSKFRVNWPDIFCVVRRHSISVESNGSKEPSNLLIATRQTVYNPITPPP
jgi:hypothetical protein